MDVMRTQAVQRSLNAHTTVLLSEFVLYPGAPAQSFPPSWNRHSECTRPSIYLAYQLSPSEVQVRWYLISMTEIEVTHVNGTFR